MFFYPLDAKIKSKGGKLRLMYEANPMAFIVEKQAALQTTGRERILDLQPTGLHQRVPVFLGSKKEIEVRHALPLGGGWRARLMSSFRRKL